jgi:MFS family permease
MTYLFSKQTFWFIALFAGLSAFVGYGQNAFITSFYIRNHGPAVEHLGALFGLKSYGFLGLVGGAIGGIAGAFGSIIGGRMSDRAGGKDPKAFATLPALVSIAWIPLMLAQVLVPNAAFSLVISALPALLGTFWYGPVYSVAQSVVPPQMRATTAAILLFTINFIGLLFGPPCFGAFNDFLAGPMGLGQAEGLRWTFVASCFIVLPAVALLLMARRSIARDIVS